MSNSIGQLFRLTSFGESHGTLVGIIIDGCPAGLELAADDIQPDLDRRKPGATPFSTPRQEGDRVEILSGVFNGHTTGAPICLTVRNSDADSASYLGSSHIPRPDMPITRLMSNTAARPTRAAAGVFPDASPPAWLWPAA